MLWPKQRLNLPLGLQTVLERLGVDTEPPAHRLRVEGHVAQRLEGLEVELPQGVYGLRCGRFQGLGSGLQIVDARLMIFEGCFAEQVGVTLEGLGVETIEVMLHLVTQTGELHHSADELVELPQHISIEPVVFTTDLSGELIAHVDGLGDPGVTARELAPVLGYLGQLEGLNDLPSPVGPQGAADEHGEEDQTRQH